MKPARSICSQRRCCIVGAFVLVTLRFIGNSWAQPVPDPDNKFWIPNGPVNTMLAVSNTIYMAGDFTYLGPRTGPAVLFNTSTGQALGAPPEITGTVRTAIPDGAGGWFIGGDFSAVGAAPILNVAHLKPDLSLDTTWNAQVNGSAINALARSGEMLYLGGQFPKVGGQNVNCLAGVSVTDGSLLWNARLIGTSVSALSSGNGVLYVAGNFTSVGGSNRQNIASIVLQTGVPSAWNPGADGAVLAVAPSANAVFIGGQFSNAGSKPRSRLAALDAITGAAVTTFNPNPNGIVRALAVGGTTVFVGGDFTTISISSRRGFAALDAVTGAAGPLDLQLESVGTANLVRSILVEGNSLYVGGQFTRALGEDHVMVAGVDLNSAQSLPVPLASTVNGASTAAYGANIVAQQNGVTFVGGDFLSFGGIKRNRVAALSAVTGAPLPWAPVFDGAVLTLASGAKGIYAGGTFTNVNGTNQARSLALIDPINGDFLNFHFRATNGTTAVTVRSLAVEENTLYVGGSFAVVANLSRRLVAALNATSGEVLPQFDAKLGGGNAVTFVARGGGNLYLAGDFTTVNSVSMPRLTAVLPTTGAPATWNPKPSPNQAINELAANDEVLFVGGQFTTISGIALRGFAAYRVVDNTLLPMDAALPNGATVSALAATPNTVYVSGSFASIGGENRRNLGALSASTAAAYSWNPGPDAAPGIMAFDDDYLYLGGTFRLLGQTPSIEKAPFFVAFARGARSQITAGAAGVQIVSTSGDRSEAVLQATGSLSNPNWTNLKTNSVGTTFTNSVPVGAAQQYFRAIAR